MEGRRILTVDIGNTAVKAGIFADERLLSSRIWFGDSTACDCPDGIEDLVSEYGPCGACYCCVGDDRFGIEEKLRRTGLPLVVLGPGTPLPIGVDYDRTTLGVDRIAAAVGVADASEAVMVVDAGTAVTIDLVADGRFLGGNISPGLKLRFRSLHAFTSRLPLVSPQGELPRFGHDTETAIRAGVVRGLAAEIAAAFEQARCGRERIRMVLTGGDAELLEPFLRDYGLEPHADSEAVGRGLVRIFETSY